jgi:cephalosporin-C deacetylase-like acetyl esterase
MTMNVAAPWGDQCSGPQTPDLAFYSVQARDLLFEKQPTIEIICQAGLRSVNMQWTLARNTFVKPFMQGEAEAWPANRFHMVIPTDKLHPGFYDLRVKLDVGEPQPVEGICTFGYQVEKMGIRPYRPADFEEFWARAKATLTGLPLQPVEEPLQVFDRDQIDAYNVSSAALPPDYDPTGHKCEAVQSGKVSFAGPDGGRVYGWLAKPVGNGPFPAMLVLPGAGVGPRPRPLEHARHGYVALDLQIHGLDVDLKQYPQMPGYNDNTGFDPPTSYYFYKVYLRVMQAVTYLASRPDVDPHRIVVVGGSQGGYLSVIAAGLDHRIAAAVPCITAWATEPYRVWAQDCNAQELPLGVPATRQTAVDGMDLAGPPPLPDLPPYRCYGYYDPLSFAPDITCPVLMNGGLIDPISPPEQVFAVYQAVGSKDKQIVPLPGHAHDWSAEFDRRAWRWLDARLK